MLFRGRYNRNPDSKGRIMIPPEFRDILLSKNPEGKMVLTTYDGCIVGFPFLEWEEFETKMAAIKNPSRNVRDFRRLVLGGAEVMNIDGQGRVRLSREHMLYSGIEKEVTMVGLGPRFEIWSPLRLEPVLNQSFDNVAEAIGDAGVDFGF